MGEGGEEGILLYATVDGVVLCRREDEAEVEGLGEGDANFVCFATAFNQNEGERDPVGSCEDRLEIY